MLSPEKHSPTTHSASPRQQLRRSARLRTISQPQSIVTRKTKRTRLGHTSSTAAVLSHDRSNLNPFEPSANSLPKRKREQDIDQPSPPTSKRLRPHPRGTAGGQTPDVEKNISTIIVDPLESWILNKSWPPECFEPNNQTREDLLEHDSWLDEMAQQAPPTVQYVEINGFKYPQPVRKAPASLRRKQSDSSLTGSSDQKNRESKSAPYRDSRYTALLAAKGSYLKKSDLGITNTSLSSYKTLLSSDQTIPTDSLFRDDVFEAACHSVQERNESRIIRSISPYVVPSAEDLAIMGATKLKCLIENVNEAWTGSIPVEGPRPQPDYSVGFRRSAFTKEQLSRLDPLVGSVFDTSFFVATYRMYFPFLTCEVKKALDVADRQNAHSMTIAVRSVVELYRAVKREKELNREILAFSISHDNQSVRIYGHYAIINDNQTTFYRHPIKMFDITSEEGKDKWSAYKFTKNVYHIWMPTHLERICSAINQLPPSLNFQVVQGSGVQSEEAIGLSQDTGSLLSEPFDTASQAGQEDNELGPIVPQTATPDTSVAKGGKQGPAKRVKKKSFQKIAVGLLPKYR